MWLQSFDLLICGLFDLVCMTCPRISECRKTIWPKLWKHWIRPLRPFLFGIPSCWSLSSSSSSSSSSRNLWKPCMSHRLSLHMRCRILQNLESTYISFNLSVVPHSCLLQSFHFVVRDGLVLVWRFRRSLQCRPRVWRRQCLHKSVQLRVIGTVWLQGGYNRTRIHGWFRPCHARLEPSEQSHHLPHWSHYPIQIQACEPKGRKTNDSKSPGGRLIFNRCLRYPSKSGAFGPCMSFPWGWSTPRVALLVASLSFVFRGKKFIRQTSLRCSESCGSCFDGRALSLDIPWPHLTNRSEIA